MLKRLAKFMEDKQRKKASKKALIRLKNRYPNDYLEFYREELAVLGLTARKQRYNIIDKDKSKDKVQKIIAERLLSREYLSALMQEVGSIREA